VVQRWLPMEMGTWRDFGMGYGCRMLPGRRAGGGAAHIELAGGSLELGGGLLIPGIRAAGRCWDHARLRQRGNGQGRRRRLGRPMADLS